VPPLEGNAIDALLRQLDDGWTAVDGHHLWTAVDGHHLEREYRFENFALALAFTNRVGEMAEEQQHHPDLLLAWGRVRVTIWTHKIDGLTESDFVFAAKADRLYRAS
jgi:4a-hydroxytetrahydrobiopterin dehydratase